MTSSSLEKQLFNRETWKPVVADELQLKVLVGSDAEKNVEENLVLKKNLCKKQIIPPRLQKKEKKTSSEIILLLKLKPLLPWNELLLYITTLWLQTSKI